MKIFRFLAYFKGKIIKKSGKPQKTVSTFSCTVSTLSKTYKCPLSIFGRVFFELDFEPLEPNFDLIPALRFYELGSDPLPPLPLPDFDVSLGGGLFITAEVHCGLGLKQYRKNEYRYFVVFSILYRFSLLGFVATQQRVGLRIFKASLKQRLIIFLLSRP